jgi:hypothetical protein
MSGADRAGLTIQDALGAEEIRLPGRTEQITRRRAISVYRKKREMKHRARQEEHFCHAAIPAIVAPVHRRLPTASSAAFPARGWACALRRPLKRHRFGVAAIYLSGARVQFTCPNGHATVRDFGQGPRDSRMNDTGAQQFVLMWNDQIQTTFECRKCPPFRPRRRMQGHFLSP